MAEFEAEGFKVRTGVLEGIGEAKIMEIVFAGVHTHHWPKDGNPSRFIAGEVATVNPAALLFDLTDYHYEFGNEIWDPLASAAMAVPSKPIMCWAIAATGITAKRLKPLFWESNLDKVFKLGLFDSVGSALAFLRRALEEGSKVRSGGPAGV